VSSSSQLPNSYGPPIALPAARRVADAALARALDRGWNVAVAVVDPAGDLVCFLRSEQVQRGSIEVAIEKARCAARFKRPTKAWEERAAGSPGIVGVPGVLALEGGAPLVAGDLIVGAVGVSGALSAEDGECAQAGLAAM